MIFTNDNGGEWLSRNAPLFHRKGDRLGRRHSRAGDLPVARAHSGGQRLRPGRHHDGSDRVDPGGDAERPCRPRQGLTGQLVAVLEGRVPEIERTLFWRVKARAQQQAVRSGDWKLLFDGGRALLFNLRTDIGERESLIGQRTDIAQRLRRLLTAWEQDVDAEAKRTATGDHDRTSLRESNARQ